MNFPYTTLPGIPKDTKRPLIPAKFIHQEKSTLPILCLVDSGADYSYLTMEIADILGIDLGNIKPQTSFGINGSPFLSYSSKITIEVGGHQLNIPVQFSNQLNTPFKCVLGQEDFFSKARITFERYKWNLDIRIIEK
ncbi:MAG: aspartyl protease family protein [Candidatus Daviesbacteria bacterium]|nr:aspartyl protease family protein [Candidatus Daviesbacteria bacterium]